MKVLWFSNTPAMGLHSLNKDSRIKSTGGWLSALNKALEVNVELYIAFHYPYPVKPFSYSNSHYIPLKSGNIYYSTLVNRFFTFALDDKYLNDYLSVINKVKPDLIHIHGTENSFLCILNNVQIPIVVSIQGNLTVIDHKYNSGFFGKYLRLVSNLNLRDLFIGLKSFRKVKTSLLSKAKIEKKRMIDIRYVFGRTDWDYRITRVLSPNSQYFVGNELLRDSFYQHHWNNLYTQGCLRLFTTNGDSYYKGIETVFHCITLLLGLGIEVEWYIAGLNEKSLVVSICKKFLGQKFPKKGFKLMGSLDELELVDELMKSHIYVMPSHIENSPNNLCEAMILGLPCVATFAGGTGSILKDGEEGILVQDGDPWAMTGAIIELMRDPEKANKYGTNARNRALKRHDKETVVQEYLTVYNSLI